MSLGFSIGYFNAIVKVRGSRNEFCSFYREISKSFSHTETVFTAFNLNMSEMMDFSIDDTPCFDDGIVYKVIFEGGLEKIILECCENNLMVEHLFSPINFSKVKGGSIIKGIINSTDTSTLVLGYELSIYSDSFGDSLEGHILDKSTHPILVDEKNNGNKFRSEYFLDTVGSLERRNTFLLDYYHAKLDMT